MDGKCSMGMVIIPYYYYLGANYRKKKHFLGEPLNCQSQIMSHTQIIHLYSFLFKN